MEERTYGGVGLRWGVEEILKIVVQWLGIVRAVTPESGLWLSSRTQVRFSLASELARNGRFWNRNWPGRAEAGLGLGTDSRGVHKNEKFNKLSFKMSRWIQKLNKNPSSFSLWRGEEGLNANDFDHSKDECSTYMHGLTWSDNLGKDMHGLGEHWTRNWLRIGVSGIGIGSDSF